MPDEKSRTTEEQLKMMAMKMCEVHGHEWPVPGFKPLKLTVIRRYRPEQYALHVYWECPRCGFQIKKWWPLSKMKKANRWFKKRGMQLFQETPNA